MINRWFEKIYVSLLPRFPASFFEKKSIRYALSTFKQACREVPAYRDFLAAHDIDHNGSRSAATFKKLPMVEKKNYLHKYPLEQLCLKGTMKDKYLIEGSSGLSGKRSYWPRLESEDRKLPGRVDLLFRQTYNIDSKPTLIIVGLMLGVWVSGEKISWALRQIAMNRKYPMTIITPGSNAEEIIDIIKHFSPLYEQTIIAAYPPFMKYLLDLGDQSNIDWRQMNIKLATGGEHFSEEWRQFIHKKLGHDEKALTDILGIYGASEMSTMMARETPYSILVRRLASQDAEFAIDLFGQATPLPTLCQYNPADYYIEAINKEVVFTAKTAMPLVRYNIHDRGGVLSFDEVAKALRRHNYDIMAMLAACDYSPRSVIRLPFLYVWGRSDGSALIYGAVIYPENIKAILDNSSLSPFWTGLFKLLPTRDAEHNEELQLKIELAIDVEPEPELQQQFLEAITSGLEQQNTDYQALRKAIGDKALLKIQLFPYQDAGIAQPDSVKHRYVHS